MIALYMLIRRLHDSDANEYHTLRLRGLVEDPDAFGSTFEEEVDLPEERILMRVRGSEFKFTLGAFDENGRMIGMATFSRFQSVKSRHKGMIAGMYVSPEARKQGVGKALLLELLRCAKQQPGLELVILDIDSRNTAATALYESVGFRIYGVQEHSMKHRGVYSDEAHMALFL